MNDEQSAGDNTCDLNAGFESEGKSEQSDVVQSESEQLRAEVVDLKDKYLRALAEFDNFRKRVAKERSELLKYQGEAILVDILEIVDSFERALASGAQGGDSEQFKQGVELIHKQFIDVLGRWEVRGESSVGKQFDPNRHRAIGKAKVPGSVPNSVIGELKKPYMYKDKLLRVGEVMVADGEAEGES